MKYQNAFIAKNLIYLYLYVSNKRGYVIYRHLNIETIKNAYVHLHKCIKYIYAYKTHIHIYKHREKL